MSDLSKKKCPRAGQGNGGCVAERTTSEKPREILYHNCGQLVENDEQAPQSAAVTVNQSSSVQLPSLHWTDVVPSVTVIVPDAASVETVALSALPPLSTK